MAENNNILRQKTITIDLNGGEPADETRCLYCNGKTVRNGSRQNKHTVKHRYLCLDCKRTFTQDAEYGKLSVEPKTIALILDLYHKGVSLRKISDHLEQFYDIKVSHIAVYKWLRKYMRLINKHVSQYKPELGSMWHGDEMMLKVDGEWLYLWNMLDKETRFLITSRLTEKRDTKDAVDFFKASMKVGGKPEAFVTDSLGSYGKAYRKVFPDHYLRNPQVRHAKLKGNKPQFIPYAGFMKEISNNPVERLHGTMRERDKVMRGLKTKPTADAYAEGYKTYYNFVRKHSKLGKTPAEEAGINLELGRNKWMRLQIGRASCRERV